MKFLITGGAGFIGSHLTESLLVDQHRVAVIDDFSTGSPENLSSVSGNPYLEVIEEDITASPHLEQLVREADCIIHLAAAVGVELVVHDPVRTIRTNVEGTDKVLTYAAERSKRCIMASTSEVYGKSAKPFFQETDDLCIGASTNSRWSYACSKLLDELGDRARQGVTEWYCRASFPPLWRERRSKYTAPANKPVVSVMFRM